MKKITLLAIALLAFVSFQANAQFSEGFEGGTTTPAGWTVINGGGPGTFVFGLPTDALPAHTGTNVASISYNSVAHDDYLVTPQINVTAGVSDQLSFWVRNRSSFFIEHYDVKLSTTGTAAANFNVTLVPDSEAPQEWTQIVINLTSYVGQSVYVGFHAVSTDEFALYFDDIVSEKVTTCPAPTLGIATVTSQTSADFTWTTGGAANSEIAILPAGSPAPSTANDTGINVVGNSYTSTTLTANTSYVFYVRDECVSGTDLSSWAGPFAFTTVVVPGCSTPISPADGATDIPAGNVTFSWTAPTSGDPATSYNLYYGLTLNEVTQLVGNFTETSALITLTGFSTVFYWRIEPVNEGGSATTCDDIIWSFTTEAAPPAPANDDCSGAIALTVDSNFCTGTTTNGTNVSATDSGVANPVCFNYGKNDVWFSFVSPANVATVDVSTDFLGGTLNDTEIALYSGSCGSLLVLGCSQDEGVVTLENGFSFNSVITNAAVTAGQTYYVRVSGYSATSTGSFCLDIKTNTTLAATSFTQNDFKAYPNPVKDILNLSYYKNIDAVSVYNVLGQEVFTKSVNAANDQIDLSSVNAGSYFVKVVSGNETKTIKVTKE